MLPGRCHVQWGCTLSFFPQTLISIVSAIFHHIFVLQRKARARSTFPAKTLYFSFLQPIDYTSTRGGVSVITNKSSTTVSSLIIQRARAEDGGKYSCHAGDLVKPSHIKVHVIHGEMFSIYEDSYLFFREKKSVKLKCFCSKGGGSFYLNLDVTKRQ